MLRPPRWPHLDRGLAPRLALLTGLGGLACASPTTSAANDSTEASSSTESGDGDPGDGDGDPGDGDGDPGDGDGDPGDGDGDPGDGDGDPGDGDGDPGDGDGDGEPAWIEYAEGLEAQAVCTSDQDACALRLDGTLVCWGASPDVVDPEATYISIAERCGLGVTSAGEVVHFLGNDFDYPFDSPPYVAVYTDGSSACAVAANGEYDCWLPHADEPGAEPIPEGLAVAFSFGFSTGCLRRPNNEIACWRLFDDSDIIPNCSAPPNAPPGHYIDMDDICGGVQLVDEQGRVHGWSMHREMLWEQTHFGAGNQKVRLAYEGYVVLQADGSLVALQGQGVGPVIPGHYASFSANPGSGIGGHSCAIRLDNHRVVCWGRNNAGQAVPPQQ